MIKRLSTGEYIAEFRNIFITGTTGCGKTYLANAFGMEACKHYYKTRYVRLPDLLLDLEHARSEGNYKKAMAKYSNPVLLIIDDWLLLKPTPNEAKDIYELLHHQDNVHQRYLALNTVMKVGMNSSEVMTPHWQMQS